MLELRCMTMINLLNRILSSKDKLRLSVRLVAYIGQCLNPINFAQDDISERYVHCSSSALCKAPLPQRSHLLPMRLLPDDRLYNALLSRGATYSLSYT